MVVTRFVVDDPDPFLERAHTALAALAARPGYVSGQLARAVDEPDTWTMVTAWESVGAYRRALSSYEVKLYATPLLAEALNEPSAFEVLAAAEPGGEVVVAGSDRADGPALRSRP
nr:antibiotic biosynthesis monooxygenase [Planosporangium thailandense]